MSKSTKGIRPLNVELPDVALNSPIIIENLPYKFVHYPNHYGTFISFSENENGEVFFCLCCKPAIENYLKFSEKKQININNRSNFLSNFYFGNSIVDACKSNNITQIIKYKEKICHRCTLSTPSIRFCHEMYGGQFKQYFGWYINQNEFRYGVNLSSFAILDEFCPEEIKMEANEILPLLRKNIEIDFYKLDTVRKKISKIIENKTREDFGFRKVGEGNISENILFRLINKIYPNQEIIRHLRPFWLNGLELDIYLPDLKIGFEYQGQQHFYPITAWGGKKALEELRIRDEKKRQLCKEQNIILIEIDYTEPLEEVYVKDKISKTFSWT